IIAGDNATASQFEEIRIHMGLDKPSYAQFGLWLMQLLRGDLGVSLMSGLPVADLIADRMGPSTALAISTILLSVVVAVPLGIIAAARQGKTLDRAVMMFSVVGFSVPVFVT